VTNEDWLILAVTLAAGLALVVVVLVA